MSEKEEAMHTRWELDEEPSADGTLAIMEGDEDRSVIAIVSPAIGDDPNKRSPSFEYARLMTAAPALYEALKAMIDFWDADRSHGFMALQSYKEIDHAARAALSAAKKQDSP